MTDNRKINRTARFLTGYIGKPVALGLFVAAVLLLVFPEFRQQPDSEQQNMMDLQQNGASSQWSGPTSYSYAVNRAAPSVVNIYTRKVTQSTNHPLLDDPYFRRLFDKPKQRVQSSWVPG